MTDENTDSMVTKKQKTDRDYTDKEEKPQPLKKNLKKLTTKPPSEDDK